MTWLTVVLLVVHLDDAGWLRWLWNYLGGYEPIAVDRAIGALRRGDFASAWPLLRLYFTMPAVVIGPPTFLMGLCYPLLQRAVQDDPSYLGRRAGRLQAAKIAGSL